MQSGAVEYRLGIDSPAARVAVADITSLMPGTLSVNLADDVWYVHALDTSMPVREQLAELEGRVARVIGN